MLKSNLITRFFLTFTAIFIILIIVSSVEQVKKTHCKIYSTIATPVFNVLNPHVYADFSQGAIESENDWDITFQIWDKREYGRQLFVKSFRDKNPPKGILYQNHRELILVPLIFLLALMIASPINIKAKLIRLAISVGLFYLFTTLYLAYRFELTLSGGNLPLDSIWHFIIFFFGLGGNTDPIYIFVFLLWAVMVIPLILKKDALLTN